MTILEAVLRFLSALLSVYADGKLTREKALAAADAAAAVLNDPGPPS